MLRKATKPQTYVVVPSHILRNNDRRPFHSTIARPTHRRKTFTALGITGIETCTFRMQQNKLHSHEANLVNVPHKPTSSLNCRTHFRHSCSVSNENWVENQERVNGIEELHRQHRIPHLWHNPSYQRKTRTATCFGASGQ